MDIRSLQLFKTLATSLHFGRTSQISNVSPSALTRVIQRLEEELGTKLFIRDNRSVQLTPAGERFLQYAEQTIGQWQLLRNDLAAGENILQGDLAIYCSVTAVYGILPHILEQFRADHPHVHIHLQTGDAASALVKVQNREVDVAIAALPETIPRGLLFHPLMETDLLFIAASPYAGLAHDSEKIDWQHTPLILAEKGVERLRLDIWLRERDITPIIYAQVAGNEAIIAMVSLGCGIGVVPALVLEKSPLREQITVIDIQPPLSSLSVGVCIPQKNSGNPIVASFWKTAKKESALSLAG